MEIFVLENFKIREKISKSQNFHRFWRKSRIFDRSARVRPPVRAGIEERPSTKIAVSRRLLGVGWANGEWGS